MAAIEVFRVWAYDGPSHPVKVGSYVADDCVVGTDVVATCPLCDGPLFAMSGKNVGRVVKIVEPGKTEGEWSCLVHHFPQGWRFVGCDACSVIYTMPPEETK